ncbi:MAG: LamG domain-containing protein [Pirellula sp.]|nr:LamG domain-containing protein [Pirellula sp.]
MHLRRFLFLVCLMASWIPTSTLLGQQLKSSLSFHASFDQGIDADVARGDASLWHAAKMDDRKGAEKGLPPGMEVRWLPEQGRFGGCLQFSESRGPMVFYRAAKNFPELKPGWSATVMFWLKTDPIGLLKEGFCDPIQITSKQWDDAAMFVEFEKRSTGIPFRLGVYADKPVWNPTNRKFEEIPPAERPLAPVDKPPFAKDVWVHVAFTVSQFNTGKEDGVAELFFDGKPVAKLSHRNQMFSWDVDQAAIMLGLGYIGSMDDLAIFDRALSPSEIQTVYQFSEGIQALTR